MSAICGGVGPGANAEVIRAMLAAVEYRGDSNDVAEIQPAVLGYRWWSGRPGKSPGIHRAADATVACCGSFAPPVACPAAELPDRLQHGTTTLDGAFAGAWWNAGHERLTLVRDPFGVRSLYYLEHGGTFYFASELKQLLAIPDLTIELDLLAVHKFLTFSFVPGEVMPVKGVRRLLPGHVGTFQHGEWETRPYFSLREEIEPRFEEQSLAVRLIARKCRGAVKRRLSPDEKQVGVYLSGGLDSSAVACWLKQAGAEVSAFTLDFGRHSVELRQAEQVAQSLHIPLTHVSADPGEIAPLLPEIAWKLDLPFGDPVTGPQYLLGRAARDSGLSVIFNGEGGDQLFGGWTSKPMISAQLFGGMFGSIDPAEQYLESYHRFYGLEDELYSERLCEAVGASVGRRRALLVPHLCSDETAFLNQVRLADIALKGSQNILPRAERMTNCWGLDMRVPLFDRELAEASFRLPPSMKLRGACEKYVLKLALQNHLPESIVWRRKFGMSVPATEWLLGPLAPITEDLLGVESVTRRGLFRSDYVEGLRRGEHARGETRRRRLGEKLWTLLMLEAWIRVFIDGRGRRPSRL